MLYSELAYRYAAAIYEIATEENKNEEYLKAITALSETLKADIKIAEFISSPLIRAEEKVTTLATALKSSGLSPAVINFTLILAKKTRLELLPEIVAAYQAREDETKGVTRGSVTSPTKLNDKQKENISKAIESVTKKKVILQYIEDKTLIGGLSARVGGLTFDDSLVAHLRRIKEDLTRRVN